MGAIRAKPELAYKDRMDRHDDACWLIWSNKWSCWYRPNSRGYTNDIAEAGVYTRAEAAQHYDGPGVPRKYRDTEPFPISSVRRHIDLCERNLDRRYAEQISSIQRLRDALNTSPHDPERTDDDRPDADR